MYAVIHPYAASITVAPGIAWCLNHTGTPRVPSDALPPPARVPGTHRSLHSATLALTVRVCGACHALLLRQCPDGTCAHPGRCVECTPRAGAARAHLCARAGSILGTWISDPVRITPQAPPRRRQRRIDCAPATRPLRSILSVHCHPVRVKSNSAGAAAWWRRIRSPATAESGRPPRGRSNASSAIHDAIDAPAPPSARRACPCRCAGRVGGGAGGAADTNAWIE
jgi:hypothetical protein